MPKSRRRKEISRPKKKRQLQQPSELAGTLRRFWRYWNIFFGIIGPLLAIYAFYPKISVSISTSIEKADVFSAPLQIKNDNLYSIYNVGIDVDAQKLKALGKPTLVLNNTTLRLPGEKKIESSRTVTRFINERVIGGAIFDKLEPSKIIVRIGFELPILPIKFKENFTFESTQTSDGSVSQRYQLRTSASLLAISAPGFRPRRPISSTVLRSTA
jgi:hypothetical protein